MRILVLGASGYVGSKVMDVLSKADQEVYGTYCNTNEAYKNNKFMFQYKLGDNSALNKILETLNPDFVISSIRGDFSLQLEAHHVITGFLEKDKNKKIIFISTSNVFDGEMEKVHTEVDIPKAKSDYGRFKIDCETLLLGKLGKQAIILRIPEVWGVNCPRLINLINSIKEQKSVQAYENIYMNYVTDEQIARWILYIIKNDLQGVFHVGSSDICEYIQFREKLRKRLQLVEPLYTIERFEEKSYQVVLPNRQEIPNFLQIKIDDIIETLTMPSI